MTTANALTLYQIEDRLAALIDSIECVPDDEPGLLAELEEDIARTLEQELRKVDSVHHMLAHFESQAAFAAAEVKRLQLRKARFERAGERLAAYVGAAMELAGKTRIEGDTTTFKLAKNPPSVLILDEAAVPACYKTHVPESWTVRKADVARDLKKGIAVPGADLSEGNMRVVWR